MDMVLVAVLLAVLASVAFGFSDIVSGNAVRRHTAASVALWAQVTGLVVLAVAALVRRPDIALGTALWGFVAGVVGALAVLAFYFALQNGPTSIVAPITGAGGLIPLAVGLARGESIGVIAIIGALATVAGIVVVAAASGDGDTSRNDRVTSTAAAEGGSFGVARLPMGTPGPAHPVPVPDHCAPAAAGGDHRASILASLSAAAGFGGFFVVLDHAADVQTAAGGGSGGLALDNAVAVALLVQVGAIVVTSLAAGRHSLECLRPTRSLLLVGPAVGLLDVVGDFSLTYAISAGPLSLVGPLGALDPIVTVLVATIFLRERLRPLQAVGVVLAVAGTLAVSLA